MFFRQRDVNFYPGWCFAIPTFLLRVPWSFLEATIWTNLVRWPRLKCATSHYALWHCTQPFYCRLHAGCRPEQRDFISSLSACLQVYWIVGFSPTVRFLMFW